MFYSSTEKKLVTLDEYVGRMPEEQKYIYYASGETKERIEKLPQTDALAALEDERRWSYQLSGGDDYELLFTLPYQHRDRLETWRQQLDIQLSVIGEIDSGEGVRCVAEDGSHYHPQGIGFEHFRHKT